MAQNEKGFSPGPISSAFLLAAAAWTACHLPQRAQENTGSIVSMEYKVNSRTAELLHTKTAQEREMRHFSRWSAY